MMIHMSGHFIYVARVWFSCGQIFSTVNLHWLVQKLAEGAKYVLKELKYYFFMPGSSN